MKEDLIILFLLIFGRKPYAFNTLKHLVENAVCRSMYILLIEIILHLSVCRNILFLVIKEALKKEFIKNERNNILKHNTKTEHTLYGLLSTT